MKTIAAIIIFLGSFFLLKNLGIIQVDFNFWGVFWPVFFIVIGLKMFFNSKQERRFSAWTWGNSPRFDRKDQSCNCDDHSCNCKDNDNQQF